MTECYDRPASGISFKTGVLIELRARGEMLFSSDQVPPKMPDYQLKRIYSRKTSRGAIVEDLERLIGKHARRESVAGDESGETSKSQPVAELFEIAGSSRPALWPAQ